MFMKKSAYFLGYFPQKKPLLLLEKNATYTQIAPTEYVKNFWGKNNLVSFQRID